MGKRIEAGPQSVDLGTRTAARELLVHRCHACTDCRSGDAPSLGERYADSPSVSRVDFAIEVAASDKGVDQLAGGLLGDAKLLREISCRSAVVSHPTEHVGRIPREVITSNGSQVRSDRLSVGASRCTHESRDGDGVFGGTGDGPKLRAATGWVKILDSQGSFTTADDLGDQRSLSRGRSEPSERLHRGPAASATSGSSSDGPNVLRLWALAALGDVVLDLLALVEGLEAGTDDVGVVDEHVLLPRRGGDEPEALFAVEKLDCSSCHDLTVFSLIFFSVVARAVDRPEEGR